MNRKQAVAIVEDLECDITIHYAAVRRAVDEAEKAAHASCHKWLVDGRYRTKGNNKPHIPTFTLQHDHGRNISKTAREERAARDAVATPVPPVCPERKDGGPHEFTPDLEYDASGNTINCEHCGEPKP